LAKLLGIYNKSQVGEDLRRLKWNLESGEAVLSSAGRG
jgi:hypothetical protein